MHGRAGEERAAGRRPVVPATPRRPTSRAATADALPAVGGRALTWENALVDRLPIPAHFCYTFPITPFTPRSHTHLI